MPSVSGVTDHDYDVRRDAVGGSSRLVKRRHSLVSEQDLSYFSPNQAIWPRRRLGTVTPECAAWPPSGPPLASWTLNPLKWANQFADERKSLSRGPQAAGACDRARAPLLQNGQPAARRDRVRLDDVGEDLGDIAGAHDAGGRSC